MRSIMKLAMCGVCLSALSMPAFAQAPAEEAVSNVDEIVVTARRRDESAQDVPLVVNAVTAEDIQKLNLRSFTDITSVVPGLQLGVLGNGTGGTASLRGVQFDINASGNNPTVEFYQNDAPISSSFVLQTMYDIGQIEVLRGPQGTLRGRASPSGSITVTTRKPDLYEFGMYSEATVNDIQTLNVNGAIGVPIIEGRLAIRAAGAWDENNADRVKTINGVLDKRDPYQRTRSGRISVRAQPIDDLMLDGSYQKLDRRSRTYDQVESFSEVNPAAAASPVLITAKDRRSILDKPRIVHQNQEVWNWQAQYSFAGQRLVYVGSRQTLDLSSFNPQDLGNRFAGVEPGQQLYTSSKQTSHEVRLQNDERVMDIFDYVVGGFDQKLNAPSDVFDATPVALPAILGGGLATIALTPVVRKSKTHEQSVFGNLTAHLGEAVELSGGLRYIKYTASSSLAVAGGAAIPGLAIDENKVVYTASAKYRFNDDLMVYASTGSSWRPPVEAVGDFSVVKSALQNSFQFLPPETSKSYEIGLKGSALDKRVKFNVAAFHQKFKNYPYRVPGAPRTSGVYYVSNAATVVNGVVTVQPTVGQFNFVGAVPVTVNGVEGDISFAATPNWDFGVYAAYSLGKIKNGVIPCNDLNGDGVPDNVTSAPTLAQLQAAVGANNIAACTVTQRSSLQSPFSANIQTEYRLDVGDNLQAYLRGLFTYSGKAQGDPTYSFDSVDAYGLLNVYAGLRAEDRKWEVGLFVKNAFNTTKVLSRTTPLSTAFQELQPPTFRTTAARTFTSTYTGITTTPPQEFGLTVRVAFGSR
jgi:iron complex outermembrane recepter protein